LLLHIFETTKLSTPLRSAVSVVLGNSMSEASLIYEASFQKWGDSVTGNPDTRCPCVVHVIPAAGCCSVLRGRIADMQQSSTIFT